MSFDARFITQEKSIRGKIVNVRRHGVHRYAFILGDNGIEYFFPISEICRRQDWAKYVWVGNRCSFIPGDNEGGESPVAKAVVPDQKIDPEAETRRKRQEEDWERHILKEERKAANRAIAEEKKLRKEAKEQEILNHLVYYVAVKHKDKWLMYNRNIVFTELEDAKADKERIKVEKPRLNLTVKKALRYEFGGKTVYIDFTHNKVGTKIA